MVEAASLFRKSGFNDEDAATLAVVAAQYQNVADTAISASDAAASIVSQIRAFGESADFATTVIDAYNEVANRFSVGTNDLSSAMEIAASGMATYGNTFQQIIGLVTSGSEIMTGRSLQVARGLNTIAGRIVQNQDALKEYGIIVEDANGNLKSTYDVLVELKPKWDAMTDAERVALGDTLAGTNQYKVLTSVLSNLSHAVEATEVAMNSAGSAAQENARFMSGLESKSAQLKATLQDLANNVIDDELVGSLLDLANGFLQLANSPIGQVVTQFALLAGLGWGATSLLKATKIIPAAVTSFTTFFSIITKGLTATAAGASAVQVALGAALPVVLAVAAGIVILVKAVKGINELIEKNKLENLQTSFEELGNKIGDVNEKLDDAKEKLKQLNTVPVADRTDDWQAERDKLELLIADYEDLLRLTEQQRKETAQKIARKDVTLGYTTNVAGQTTHPGATEAQHTALTATYKDEAAALFALAKAYDLSADTNATMEERLESYRKQLRGYGIEITAVTQSGEEYNKQLSKQAGAYVGILGNTEKLTDAKKAEIKTWVEDNSTRVEALRLSDNLNTQEKLLIKSYDKLTGAVNGFNKEQEILATGLDKVNSAIEAYNKNGKLSLSTMKDLETVLPGISKYLRDESGAISDVGKEALKSAESLLKFALAQRMTVDQTGAGAGIRERLSNAAMYTWEGGTGGGVDAETKRILEMLNSLYTGKSKVEEETTTGGGTGTPAWVKEAEAAFDLLEHQRNMDLISEEEYYEKLNRLNEKYYAGKSDYLSTYWSNQEKYYKWQKEQEEAAAERQQEQIKAVLQSQVDSLNEQQEKLGQIASAAQKQINDRLEELNDIVDDINAQYDAELEALEAQNDALDDQINKERLLQNLAKAQASMKYVFKDGRFQYVSDIDEVSSAQGDIADYEREQALNQAKQDIEERRNLALKDVQDEISHYEQLSEIWSNYASQYEDSINLQIYIQEYGKDMEAMTFAERLANAQDFVSQYNAIMASLSSAQAALSGYSGGDTLESLSAEYYAARARGDAAGMESANRRANILRGLGDIVTATTAIEAARSGHIPGYANGTFSASGGLSLVGENGPELRVLGRGDGVLSSNVTRSLFRAAQSPGVFMRQVMGGGNTSINVSNITLPNVRDAQGFLDGLRNLAYQRAYAR